MFGEGGNSRDTRRAFAMAGVGLEIALPVLLGWGLDQHFGWSPWGVLVGGVLGLGGGLWHMVLLSKDEPSRPAKPPSSGTDVS